MEWINTSEQLVPIRLDPKIDCTECMIVRHDYGKIMDHAFYDYYHNCWNDGENDDYFCKPEQVRCWLIIPSPPKD